MSQPNFDQLHLSTPDMRHALERGDSRPAADRAAAALSDLAATRFAGGDTPRAIEHLKQALALQPGCRQAFHNLVAVLFAAKLLRGENLQTIQRFLAEHWQDLPWARQYVRLLYMPKFLNLEFVLGKCNLKCRMCVGVNAEGHADRLSYMSVEDFERMLDAAPTIDGITLSSGDSEPLLHPDFERVVQVAAQRQMRLDVFTNGLPLTARKCRSMIDSKAVSMINFSLDAATPETYRRIRGQEMDRVLGRIEMLQAMKKESGASMPWLSLSFVAMKDNVEELPAFVDLAKRLGVLRVFVDDLIGWDGDDNRGNDLATDHPRCFEFVAEASRRAAEAGLHIELPQRLRQHNASQASSSGVVETPPLPSPGSPVVESPPAARGLSYCGWMGGVWVQEDGRLDPCCLVHDVADMGDVRDGPLHKNEKFARVKELLLTGKVFEACANQRMCIYVQQQQAAGIPLRFITAAELGALAPPVQVADPATTPPDAPQEFLVSLPLLSTP